jgi:exosortase/archaeosortase family protein
MALPRLFDPARVHLPWWAGRVALLVVIVAGGYWLSLSTLLRDLGGQTPTAFVGLAPLLALGLLLAGLLRRAPLPTPGRIDLVVGLGLIAAAGSILLVAPFAASVYFWAARLDILSLPLFVAGALIFLFGWRVVFVSRAALLLVLLTWPLPYLVLIENTSELLTQTTAAALDGITRVLPIASVVPGTSATFTVAYPPAPFQIQVATACAGLNSTVAFLLVGGAFAMLMMGRLPAKLAWLAVGLVLIFLLNVVRVVLLVAVGAAFGRTAALDLFHPVAGLVALFAGLLTMLWLLPRFGLTVPAFQPARSSGPARIARPDAPAPRHGLAWRSAILVVLAILFGTVNATFASYERAPESAAAAPLMPKLEAGAGTASRPVIADRVVTGQQDIDVGKPYFGQDSTWVRYTLGRIGAAARADNYRLWLDDIRVTDRQRLVDFGVEKCYRFHGQSIDAAQPIALGNGVIGEIVQTEFNQSGTPWLVLWWEWPILVGDQTLHERLVLLAPATVSPTTKAPTIDGTPPLLFDFGTAVPAEHQALANDLAALAHAIVIEQYSNTASR